MRHLNNPIFHFSNTTRFQLTTLAISVFLPGISHASNDGWSTEVRTEYRHYRDSSLQSETITPAQISAASARGIKVPSATSIKPIPGDELGSVVIIPQYQTTLASGTKFNFTGFIRYDDEDEERFHTDIRELVWAYQTKWNETPWDVRLGVDKVYWGVAESNHLVDVVNQQDLVETITKEERMGQPMARFNTKSSWGNLEFLVLPFFRDQTAPGPYGRLRTPVAYSVSTVRFEDPAGRTHLDLATRWSQRFSMGDVGVHYFRGTNREPRITQDDTAKTSANQLGQVLNYDQMWQMGIDGSLIQGDWIFKGEYISRHTAFDANTYYAAVGGFEYVFSQAFGTDTDINLFFERNVDARGYSGAVLQNDNFFGARFSFNDAQSTTFQIGIMRDQQDYAKSIRWEGSRRLTDNMSLKINGFFFADVPDENLISSISHDTYYEVSLSYHF